ncbi:MAG: bifunctional lysylphosphatidylglycerol flippase/synthetase MprF [Candidatus Eremiobacteraeota bacterium]|nr:bifunctional lysylphosphatidylglycerol flippase/synthetase MprF [Candidatus Eremiobacteraeota bacterium]
MVKKLSGLAAPAISIILFFVALRTISHLLREHNYHDIISYLKAMPALHVTVAVILTMLGYFTLTLYDFLALHYVKFNLPYRNIALASFISYAFSNTIGFSFLSGGSVRYRLYTSWGIQALDIAKILAFCSATLWLGFFAIAGTAFTRGNITVPAGVHLPFHSLHALGALFLMAVLGYLVLCTSKKRSFLIKNLEFTLPRFSMACAQVVLASLDWLVAASVLYILLPQGDPVNFFLFIALFLLAQIAGVASQVPGGLGIFESVMMLLLGPSFNGSQLIASLLAFRLIYYLLPLIVAAALLGIQEILHRKESMKQLAGTLSQWIPAIAPYVLSLATLIGGATLLFSGALPADKHRIRLLVELVPLPVLEISHFLGSLVGTALLLLAWGIQRRIDAAYHLTVALLCSGIVFSLLRGLNYEEALVLLVMLLALLPAKQQFYRKSSLTSASSPIQWASLVIIILLCSLWLGSFSHKHVEYSHELWWNFSLKGDAPRFLRASIGAVALLLFFAIGRLFRPAAPSPGPPSAEDLAKARAIVEASPRTYPSISLLGDKNFLFSESGRSFLMFGTHGRTWVALGDPAGLEEEKAELTWQLRELVDRHDGRTVYYDVQREYLHLYVDLGLTLLKLGEEARVPLGSFSMEGSSRKKFRNLISKLEKEGSSFEILPKEEVVALLPELKAVSDAWLAHKNTREKKFTLGNFSKAYLSCFPAAIVRYEGRIMAFANLWTGAGKEEISIDLMRYIPEEAPSGVMEYLFIKLIAWSSQEGYRWFNLGMASLSGLEDRALAPLWNRLGSAVFRHGEHFYNFQGLRQYKEKFDPLWEPKYIAYPGGLTLPSILADIAFLTAGGIKGIVAK